MEFKSIALRPRGRPKMRWEDDIQQELKVMKICHWKKREWNGNGLLSKPKLTKSCKRERERERERE